MCFPGILPEKKKSHYVGTKSKEKNQKQTVIIILKIHQ